MVKVVLVVNAGTSAAARTRVYLVRRAGVVGVVVGVDQMGHGVTDALGRRELVHGPPQVVTDGRRGVE